MSDPNISALLYGGAIRGAKTYLLGLGHAIRALSFPKSRWTLMRKDTPRITTNLLPSISACYSQPEIARHIRTFNQNKLEFHFKNDSIVKLFPESFDQDKTLSRFLGLEMNGFGFDELNEFQQITYEHAFVRAGSWLNAEPNKFGHDPKASVDASCNPNKGWVKEVWYDPWKDNGEVHPNPNWKYIQARITDNPWVSPEYLLQLKRNMTPMNYQRFVAGDWDYVERQGHEWLYQFDHNLHVKQVQYDRYAPTFLTYDFNVVPYMTLLAFQVKEENGYWFIRFYDEFCLEHPRNNSRDVTQEWVKKYPKQYGSVPVSYCGDRSGENRVPGFGEDKAFNEVRRVLQPYLHNASDRVYKKQFFNEFIRTMLNDALSGVLPIAIQIDPKCKNLIKDIQMTLESKDGGFLKEKGVYAETQIPYEKNGHCVDAMKYGFLSVFSDVYLKQYHNRQY